MPDAIAIRIAETPPPGQAGPAVSNDTRFLRAASASAIMSGAFEHVVIAGHDLLICNVGGVFYAIENRCSHQKKPLDQGRLVREGIVCPFHGATFDVRTGASTGFPKCRSIRHFITRVVGDDVEVALT